MMTPAMNNVQSVNMITLLSGYQMKKPSTKIRKAKKVSKVMKEFKAGSLHSGKGGKVVKSPKQAIAIALSEAGMAKKKGK
jgi:ribosomal protein L21E